MNRYRHALAAAPLSLAVAFTLASGQVTADMQTETVEYTVNGKTFTGYMAYDDEAEGKRPGVLVVHEWWGHNEFAREQAEKLAAAGYGVCTGYVWLRQTRRTSRRRAGLHEGGDQGY